MHQDKCQGRKRTRPSSNGKRLSYAGYEFDHDDQPTLDRVDPRKTTPEVFFRDYVARRKPCILTSHMVPKTLTCEQVKDLAGDVEVQVEMRIDPQDAFGQNRTSDRQRIMTVRQLFDLWETPDNRALYYLSTQIPDEHGHASQGDDPFFGPCRRLVDRGALQQTLTLAGNLRLESCNMWMGMAHGSSGLHHDYHDNFYLLMSGEKQFRLYSPSDFPVMETYGTLHCLHENGLISYLSEPLRSDGIPLRLLQDQGEADLDESEESDGEENVVLGKGFDYESSDDDEAFSDGVDDFEEQMGDLHNSKDEGGDKIDENVLRSEERRPDSFSIIDPTQSRRLLLRDHEDFYSAKECSVEIKAGEALYLPASWFHCVSSSSKSDSCHLAFNYWYFPPDDVMNFHRPYKHS